MAGFAEGEKLDEAITKLLSEAEHEVEITYDHNAEEDNKDEGQARK